MQTLAVIGGSGFYGLKDLKVLSEFTPSTPYGSPSAPIVEAVYHGVRLLFLPRHGANHEIAPHRLNFRANICALKMLGAEQVVSISAVGSMSEHIPPGDVVIVDQYIDWTKTRVSTFFDEGLVAHVSMADPVCENLALACGDAAEKCGLRVHRGGTYLCMEGPQFSTRAESLLYRKWGVSVIGMTAMPEAKLAREAELPYATVAFSTDYDCWHETEDDVTVEAVVAVLRANANHARMLLGELVLALPDPQISKASSALQGALISGPCPASEKAKKKLAWLLAPAGDSSLKL